MKLTKVLILSLGMALCAAGGVGTALATGAFSRSSASSTGSGEFDKAVYLYWDSEAQTSASLGGDITSLSSGSSVYRHLVVTPKSSKSVTGTVTVSFSMATQAVEGKTATLDPITISVWKLDAAPAGDITADPAGEAVVNLDKDHLAGSTTFAIAAGEGVHETVQHLAIKVARSNATIADGAQVSAVLTISQSFAA